MKKRKRSSKPNNLKRKMSGRGNLHARGTEAPTLAGLAESDAMALTG